MVAVEEAAAEDTRPYTRRRREHSHRCEVVWVRQRYTYFEGDAAVRGSERARSGWGTGAAQRGVTGDATGSAGVAAAPRAKMLIIAGLFFDKGL